MLLIFSVAGFVQAFASVSHSLVANSFIKFRVRRNTLHFPNYHTVIMKSIFFTILAT